MLFEQYVKQAMQQFRESPLVTGLSVAGTALAVAVILVMVLVFQINLAGFAPESHRDRFLYVFGTEANSRSGGCTQSRFDVGGGVEGVFLHVEVTGGGMWLCGR